MRLCLTILLSLFTVSAWAQSPGDIAIIGMNADAPDQFAFVTLVPLDAGTAVHFTNNGWRANDTFRTGEGTYTYTVGETGLPAGEVIVVDQPEGLDFSDSGDQLLAYVGAEDNPTFIYAISVSGLTRNNVEWQNTADDENTSALPRGLHNWSTAVTLNERDNVAYIGPTSGTQAQLLAAIGDRSNWQGSNSNAQAFAERFEVAPTTNLPPVAAWELEKRSLRVNIPFGYGFGADDPEGEAVFHEILDGPGTINPETGSYRWTPSERDIGKIHEVVIRATDGVNDVLRSAVLRVLPRGPNYAPYFDSTQLGASAVFGEDARLQVFAQDLNQDSLRYEIVEGPPGARLEYRDGVYLLVYAPRTVGAYRFVLQVTDGEPQSFDEIVVGIIGTPKDQLFAGQTGETLRASVAAAYAPRQTLGYDRGLDTLLTRVANYTGTLRGSTISQSVEAIYSDVSFGFDQAAPLQSLLDWGYFIESLWPESMGAGAEPQRSDMHMLHPVRVEVADARGDLPFGVVDSADVLVWYRGSDALTSAPERQAWSYSKQGADAFEPRAWSKGRVARAMFYFWTMYPEAANRAFFEAQAETLIEWNEQYPPSWFEMARSARIQHYQGNLNPFILDTSLMRRMWTTSTQREEEEQPAAAHLSVYPNPVHHQATLSVDLDAAHMEVHVDVFDLLGRRVHAQQYPALPPGVHQLALNVSGLASGMYLLRATLDDEHVETPLSVIR